MELVLNLRFAYGSGAQHILVLHLLRRPAIAVIICFRQIIPSLLNYSLLEPYRYIEMNSVRAGMVEERAGYSWSSYQCNALGRKRDLLTRPPLFSELGINGEARQSANRDLFREHVEGKLLEQFRGATNKGLALGNERFIEVYQPTSLLNLHQAT